MANSPHEMMVPLRTESDLPLALIGGKAVSPTWLFVGVLILLPEQDSRCPTGGS